MFQVNNFFTDIYRNVSVDQLNDQQKLAYDLEYVQMAIHTMYLHNLTRAQDAEPHTPWFLECNKERYPYWWGEPDTRNKVFVDALKKGDHQDINDDEETKLFLIEGCNEHFGENLIPCRESWIKINKTVDDPGAVVWARRVLIKKEEIED